jgi:glycosyltransferase involved in cell wall biosynthesis
MINGFKVVVIMPAYNAEQTLARTYADIPKDLVDHIILVDDHSSDNTVVKEIVLIRK